MDHRNLFFLVKKSVNRFFEGNLLKYWYQWRLICS